MSYLIFLIELVCLLGVNQVWAQNFQRNVKIEWVESLSAKNYELEIKSSQGQIQKFEVSDPAWVGSLVPDSYSFRVRAKDRRGLAGPWSSQEKLMVKIPSVKLLSPAPEAELIFEQKQSPPLEFSWVQSRGGAQGLSYHLVIKGEEGFSVDQRISESVFSTELPVTGKFKWTVSTVLENGQESEPVIGYVTLLTSASTKPKLEIPKNKFVREIRWTVGPSADQVEVTLYRFDEAIGDFALFQAPTSYSERQISFLPDWPGGKYRVSAAAKKAGKIISQKDELEFEVQTGDRSVASESRYYIESFLSREKGDFAHLNYIASQVRYSATSPEINARTDFSALTGTLQAGYGRLLDPKWGVRGLAGLGGIVIDKKNYLLTEGQAQVFRRLRISETSDSRFWSGLSLKTLPEASKSMVSTEASVKSLMISSLTFGGDVWYALNGKWGLKGQGSFEVPILGESSGGGKVSGLVQRYSIFSTFNLNSERQVHVGYTINDERYSFSGTSGESKIQISGSYLNLQLEVGF